jgi:hypothetical protein
MVGGVVRITGRMLPNEGKLRGIGDIRKSSVSAKVKPLKAEILYLAAYVIIIIIIIIIIINL